MLGERITIEKTGVYRITIKPSYRLDEWEYRQAATALNILAYLCPEVQDAAANLPDPNEVTFRGSLNDLKSVYNGLKKEANQRGIDVRHFLVRVRSEAINVETDDIVLMDEREGMKAHVAMSL